MAVAFDIALLLARKQNIAPPKILGPVVKPGDGPGTFGSLEPLVRGVRHGMRARMRMKEVQPAYFAQLIWLIN